MFRRSAFALDRVATPPARILQLSLATWPPGCCRRSLRSLRLFWLPDDNIAGLLELPADTAFNQVRP
jgi:hypothetical protein